MTWTWKINGSSDNNSRTMSSAFVVEQQSSINQKILCPRDFSLYYTEKHPLLLSSSFWVITCSKWILLGTFFLPVSDFAHHLNWQRLNLKFMGVIRNEWIIVQINPVWSGGIVSRMWVPTFKYCQKFVFVRPSIPFVYLLF